MKKIIILSFILINCIACSNGQNKNDTNSAQDLSTEILGCWKSYDVHHEIKSNYPNIDTIALERQKLYFATEMKNPYIIRFNADNTVHFYSLDGTSIAAYLYYNIENDSLSVEDINSLRLDTKSTSKISIKNDTLYQEIDVFDEFNSIITDLKFRKKEEIPNNIEIKTAKRSARFVRVADCDQYKEEEE